MEILHCYHCIWKYTTPYWDSCLSRGCGENVTRCKCSLVFLFQFISYAYSNNSLISWRPSSMSCMCCDLHSRGNRKFDIVGEEWGMFPGWSKTIDMVGFIREPIKLSVRTWDGTCMLLKQIAQLTEVNFTSLNNSFLSPKRLSGVGKGYVTRKLPKLCRFHNIYRFYNFFQRCTCFTFKSVLLFKRL